MVRPANKQLSSCFSFRDFEDVTCYRQGRFRYVLHNVANAFKREEKMNETIKEEKNGDRKAE
jgi:hypothetical protein